MLGRGNHFAGNLDGDHPVLDRQHPVPKGEVIVQAEVEGQLCPAAIHPHCWVVVELHLEIPTASIAG